MESIKHLGLKPPELQALQDAVADVVDECGNPSCYCHPLGVQTDDGTMICEFCSWPLSGTDFNELAEDVIRDER